MLLRASVVEVEPDAAGARVTGLALRSVRGRAARAAAQHCLLAAGGIENPRLLLASRRTVPAGLGNARDTVGRRFMEHPYWQLASLVTDDASGLADRYYRRVACGRLDRIG